MNDDYLTLVGDTISFLKEQKKRAFFVSEEEISFFQKSPILQETIGELPKAPAAKKETAPQPRKPTFEKPKALPQERKEEIVIEKKIPEKGTSSFEKLTAPLVSFEELKKIITSIAPHYVLHDEPPNDEKAKQIGQSWFYKKNGAPITLLYGKEDPMKVAFLKNVERAISLCYSPAKLVSMQEIEKENGWEPFLENKAIKLIIAPNTSLQEFPKLMSYFREFPVNNERKLKEIPLLLISDVALYFKKSSLKAILWKTIQQKIKELLPHE